MLLGSKKVNNFIVKKYFKGKEILEKFKLSANAVKEPFQIMYQIPKYVFLISNRNDLNFAQYDYSSEKWVPLTTA